MQNKFSYNVIIITIILMKKDANEQTRNTAYPPYDLINYC